MPEENCDKIVRRETAVSQASSRGLPVFNFEHWREMPKNCLTSARSIKNRAVFSFRLHGLVVRRLFGLWITDFRRLPQRRDSSLQSVHLTPIRLQFRVHIEQSLMHLFKVMLSVGERHFDAYQTIVVRCGNHSHSAKVNSALVSE